MLAKLNVSGNRDGVVGIIPILCENLSGLSEMNINSEFNNENDVFIKLVASGSKKDIHNMLPIIVKELQKISDNISIETIFQDDQPIHSELLVNNEKIRIYRQLWRNYSDHYKEILFYLANTRLSGRVNISGYEIADHLNINPPKAITGVFSSDGSARKKLKLGNDWKLYSYSNGAYTMTEENAHIVIDCKNNE